MRFGNLVQFGSNGMLVAVLFMVRKSFSCSSLAPAIDLWLAMGTGVQRCSYIKLHNKDQGIAVPNIHSPALAYLGRHQPLPLRRKDAGQRGVVKMLALNLHLPAIKS